MEPIRRVATRLGHSDSAPSHRLLEDGNRESYNTDRINAVEESLAELDGRLGQVNERLDRVLDGIQLLSGVVERNQETANQNTEIVSQMQAFAEQTATTINYTALALHELQQNAASV
ncbi:hypothetical protein L917_15830 [Phytophthora nicotianae]|uniref:Uncharacterized protein n=2 Tax=Phytophthora nicotianae TaxID=4792 RepID=W2PQG1_PHYN3|nr:hypothetical protein PPTG_15819 [Phytophthora nicotianae INRA-310]XP_008914941.1 hypothetical protein PPTG_18468 [Phytophthora nicotianae INRA-310]ETL84316.1 hypothetical protein L917_15830 [Phytophthora nicotianae]ETM99692.1 hypothetical protein PPTG_18468 [Phytophthora nicotianae INRA-310]ETN02861.1 hypothetical protein PPTG_15819 [Phytophthora nicotianae INRA-310]